MRRLLWFALAVALGWAALGWWRLRPLHPAPGVLAAAAPVQVDLDDGIALQRGEVTLRPRAHIALTARVLGREDYHWDAGAALAPMDLALGWGRMSDSAVLAGIDIHQSARFAYWRVDTFPIPQREIETSSTNMHLIPADEGVRRAMQRVRPGQLVSIDGFLVDASRPDGWQWRTSLSREDTGDGACELVFVEMLVATTP